MRTVTLIWTNMTLWKQAFVTPGTWEGLLWLCCWKCCLKLQWFWVQFPAWIPNNYDAGLGWSNSCPAAGLKTNISGCLSTQHFLDGRFFTQKCLTGLKIDNWELGSVCAFVFMHAWVFMSFLGVYLNMFSVSLLTPWPVLSYGCNPISI